MAPSEAVAFETPAHEWPAPWRYGTAVVNGVAWAFLWFGLDALGAPWPFFPILTGLFVAPVLAFLGRSWADFAALLASAVAVSLGISFAIVPGAPSLLLEQTVHALRAWLPALLTALALYALRRRFLRI